MKFNTKLIPIVFGLIILIMFLFFMLCAGCNSTIPTPITPIRPHRTDINQLVDNKVTQELPKALTSIIGQNVVDYAPYAIAILVILVSILYGKKHIDLKNLKNIKKNYKI